MRQTGSVEDFIQKRTELRVILPHDLYMSESFEIHNFTRALKPREKEYVMGKLPKTLGEAHQHALDYEKTTGRNHTNSQKKFGTPNFGFFIPPPQQRKFDEAVPMDLNTTKTGRMSKIQCYNCRQMGHISRQCPHTGRTKQVNLTGIDVDTPEDKMITVPVRTYGEERRGLLDTGASADFVDKKFVERNNAFLNSSLKLLYRNQLEQVEFQYHPQKYYRYRFLAYRLLYLCHFKFSIMLVIRSEDYILSKNNRLRRHFLNVPLKPLCCGAVVFTLLFALFGSVAGQAEPGLSLTDYTKFYNLDTGDFITTPKYDLSNFVLQKHKIGERFVWTWGATIVACKVLEIVGGLDSAGCTIATAAGKLNVNGKIACGIVGAIAPLAGGVHWYAGAQVSKAAARVAAEQIRLDEAAIWLSEYVPSAYVRRKNENPGLKSFKNMVALPHSNADVSRRGSDQYSETGDLVSDSGIIGSYRGKYTSGVVNKRGIENTTDVSFGVKLETGVYELTGHQGSEVKRGLGGRDTSYYVGEDGVVVEINEDDSHWWEYTYNHYGQDAMYGVEADVGGKYQDTNGFGKLVDDVGYDMGYVDKAGSCVCFQNNGEWVSTGTLTESEDGWIQSISPQCWEANCGGA
ncbi:hypothetical protein E3Q11_04459 [Wallemia mellicola]|nr:hypothetical protein E3Q11_04459 [Wallemia mellicola]